MLDGNVPAYQIFWMQPTELNGDFKQAVRGFIMVSNPPVTPHMQGIIVTEHVLQSRLSMTYQMVLLGQ